MSGSTSLPARLSNRAFYVLNGLFSVAALALLAYVLYGRTRDGGPGVDLRFMPAVNASLNALSATLLCTGYYFVRRGQRDVHRRFMLMALGASLLFLVGYVAYHYVHGDTKYQGTGVLRTVYLVVLASHVLLSMLILPMVLATVFFAVKGSHARHRKIARFTLPVWLYVSVTGVAIFFMLRASIPS